jgi:hypothetical protein
MKLGALINTLSKRAPHVVIGVLVASIVGPFVGAPDRLLNASAFVVGCLGLMLWAAKGLPIQFRSNEDLGFIGIRNRLAFELSAKGAPRGFCVLGLAAGATTVLTGGQPLAFAAFMLNVSWGIVETQYPAAAKAAWASDRTATSDPKPNI